MMNELTNLKVKIDIQNRMKCNWTCISLICIQVKVRNLFEKKKNRKLCETASTPTLKLYIQWKKSHATKNKKEYENSIIATKKTTHKVREKKTATNAKKIEKNVTKQFEELKMQRDTYKIIIE